MRPSLSDRFREINSLIVRANTVELRDAVLDRIDALMCKKIDRKGIPLNVFAEGLEFPLEALDHRIPVLRKAVRTLLLERFPPVITKAIEGTPSLSRVRKIDADYFTSANVLHDLQAYADKLGEGKTIADLNTWNMLYTNIVCANHKRCGGQIYINRAGVALGMANNYREARSRRAPILVALKCLAGVEVIEYPPMDAAYFTSANVLHDLQAYADKFGGGKTIVDLNAWNMQGINIVCANKETCRGAAYINRAGVALGMAKGKGAPIFAALKRLAGIEVAEAIEYPPMDAAYFTSANVLHDLQAYADKLGGGKTIANLGTGNMQGINIVCANKETCRGAAYINRAGVALGMAKSKQTAVLIALKRLAGIEVPPLMDAAYFTPANVRHDLQAYADKLGGGKTIANLGTGNMQSIDIVCANNMTCEGQIYINRAGVALGMANNYREARSHRAPILAALQRLANEAIAV